MCSFCFFSLFPTKSHSLYVDGCCITAKCCSLWKPLLQLFQGAHGNPEATCFWGCMTFCWYIRRSTGLSCLPVVISFSSGKSCFFSPSVLVCGLEERGNSSLVWMEHQFRDTGFLPSIFFLFSSFFCRVSWFTCALASVNMKWGYNFPAICTKT